MDITSNIIYYTDAYLHGFQDISESKDNIELAKGVAKVCSYILTLGVLPFAAYMANFCASLNAKKIDKINTESTINPVEGVKKATKSVQKSNQRNPGIDSVENSHSKSMNPQKIDEAPPNKNKNDQKFLKELENWTKRGTSGENREKAKEKILNAYTSNSNYLDLSCLKLNSLPENIGDLTALQELYLFRNQLTQLPDCIEKLTALRFLDLSCNQLTQLPDSIGDLTALKKLELSGNQLTQLPDSIGDLTALKKLELSGNQLTQLPDCIGDLTALKKLELSGNQLTQLPDCIKNLIMLRFLDLSCNRLTQLPKSIGDLIALKKLDLFGNQLIELPDSIGDLIALQTLDLWKNQLTQLPKSIENLTALKRLFLPKNLLTQLPIKIKSQTEVLLNIYY